jgi:hypothetical protein
VQVFGKLWFGPLGLLTKLFCIKMGIELVQLVDLFKGSEATDSDSEGKRSWIEERDSAESV